MKIRIAFRAPFLRSAVLCAACAALIGARAARADDVPDGVWHSNGGAALSVAAGNTRSENFNLSADTKRIIELDRWSFYGQVLYGRSEIAGHQSTTASLARAGGRYDRNLTLEVYAFTGLDFERDQVRQLLLRSVASVGLGTAVLKTDASTWNIFGGATYKLDRYAAPGVIVNDVLRTRYGAPELTVGEESSHKISETATLHQRLAVFSEVRGGGSQRANFDSGLAVAVTKRASLTVSLQDRYDGLARSPVRKNDLLFMTGFNVKFDSE